MQVGEQRVRQAPGWVYPRLQSYCTEHILPLDEMLWNLTKSPALGTWGWRSPSAEGEAMGSEHISHLPLLKALFF